MPVARAADAGAAAGRPLAPGSPAARVALCATKKRKRDPENQLRGQDKWTKVTTLLQSPGGKSGVSKKCRMAFLPGVEGSVMGKEVGEGVSVGFVLLFSFLFIILLLQACVFFLFACIRYGYSLVLELYFVLKHVFLVQRNKYIFSLKIS